MSQNLKIVIGFMTITSIVVVVARNPKGTGAFFTGLTRLITGTERTAQGR